MNEMVWVVHPLPTMTVSHQRGHEPGSCSAHEVGRITGTNLAPKVWRVPRRQLVPVHVESLKKLVLTSEKEWAVETTG